MSDTDLERLFGNEYRILKMFLSHQGSELTLSDVTSATGIHKMTAYRVLERMTAVGILKSRSDDYRKFYRLKEMTAERSLKVLVNLDSGVISDLVKRFGKRSKLMLLYGSRADGTDTADSDWDILVVSDELDGVDINDVVSALEKKHDAQINVNHYSVEEYGKMRRDRTIFYQQVLSSKYVLEGEPDEV